MRTIHVGPTGIATVAGLPCGEPLELLPPPGWGDQVVRIRGPAEPDTTIQAELRIPADTTVLTGRLLWPDLRPHHGPAHATICRPNGMQATRVDCGIDGSFLLPLKAAPKQSGTVSLAVREAWSASNHSALVPALAELAPGLHALGTLFLTATPLLVSGSIAGRNLGPSPRQLELQIGAAENWERWQPLATRSVPVDAEGRFRVHADWHACRYRLRLVDAASGPTVLEFAPGTRELRIDADSSAPTTYRFRLPPGAAQVRFELVPVNTSGELPATASRATNLGVQQRHGELLEVQFRTGAGGRHRLQATGPLRETLWTTEVDLPTTAGSAIATPPEYDLTSAWRTFAVTVRDPGGMALADCTVLILDTATSAWVGTRTNSTGRVEFLLQHPAELLVAARRHVGVHRSGFYEDLVIVLPAASPTTFALTGVPELPPGGKARVAWSMQDRLLAETKAHIRLGPGAWRSDRLEGVLAAIQLDSPSGDADQVPVPGPVPFTARLVLEAPGVTTQYVELEPAASDGLDANFGSTVRLRPGPNRRR